MKQRHLYASLAVFVVSFVVIQGAQEIVRWQLKDDRPPQPARRKQWVPPGQIAPLPRAEAVKAPGENNGMTVAELRAEAFAYAQTGPTPQEFFQRFGVPFEPPGRTGGKKILYQCRDNSLIIIVDHDRWDENVVEILEFSEPG